MFVDIIDVMFVIMNLSTFLKNLKISYQNYNPE